MARVQDARSYDIVLVSDQQMRVLGGDDPNTLITRRDIARAMRQQGQCVRAEEKFREVLAAQIRVLGADNQSTLITSYEIAWVMADRRDFTGAETEFRNVFAAWLRVLGPDHPTTLATRRGV